MRSSLFALVSLAVSFPLLAEAQPLPAGPLLAVAPRPAPTLRVLAAQEAFRVRDGSRLGEGALLAEGELLRTGKGGGVLVALPDDSRVGLGPNSSASVARASDEQLVLAVEKGRAAVQAARTPGRECVVKAGDFAVRGGGATFSVALTRGTVEVAVGEGRAHVERPNALPMLVDAGSRVAFSPRTPKTTRLALNRENQAELSRVAVPPSPRVAPEEEEFRGLAAAAAEVAPPSPGDAPAAFVPFPGAPMSPPAPLPVAEAPVAAVEPAPALAPAPLAPLVPVVEPPAEVREEVAASQPAPPVAAADELYSDRDLEDLYLLRAERSLRRGGCTRLLAALEEIASDRPATENSERARILRARCFAREGHPERARAEYGRYLSEVPGGLFAAEARQRSAAP